MDKKRQIKVNEAENKVKYKLIKSNHCQDQPADWEWRGQVVTGGLQVQVSKNNKIKNINYKKGGGLGRTLICSKLLCYSG